MKIECVKDKLKQAVNLTERIVGRNLSLPVLANIFIEAKNKKVVIKSTNLDIGIEVSIPAIVTNEGDFTVKPQILSGLLNNLNTNNDKIKLEISDGNMKIITDNSSTIIKCDPSDDFPTLPVVREGKEITIFSDDLINGFKAVYFASSLSDIKPEISSVFIYKQENDLVFVSTDSFRLAEKKIAIKNNNINTDFDSLIIPIKNVSEIMRVFDGYSGDIKIICDNNQISFYGDNIYLTSRLIDGVYPDYKQIMPTDFKTKVKLKKIDFIQALKLSNIFINKLNQISLELIIKDGLLKIKSENQDVGENIVSLPVDIDSGENDIIMSFNVRYIMECFNSIDSENISIGFNELNKPVFIQGENNYYFSYIIMPLNR